MKNEEKKREKAVQIIARQVGKTIAGIRESRTVTTQEFADAIAGEAMRNKRMRRAVKIATANVDLDTLTTALLCIAVETDPAAAALRETCLMMAVDGEMEMIVIDDGGDVGYRVAN